jgi:HSP20 family protein
MAKDDLSFFEKLAGAGNDEPSAHATSARASILPDAPHQEEEEEHVPESKETVPPQDDNKDNGINKQEKTPEETSDDADGETWLADLEDTDGQLTVDVYQTPTHVVVQAPMAGVKPDDVDVSINNDMVTIRGKRDQKSDMPGNDCYYRELFWGPFSRSVLLPEEVDSDRTEASFKNGLLTVRMPKVNKEGVQKVKIQTKEI